MDSFSTSIEAVDDIIEKAKEVAKGKSLATAGIDSGWLTAYAEVARRCRDEREFGLSRYPYEAGPAVSAFNGGFFDHKQ